MDENEVCRFESVKDEAEKCIEKINEVIEKLGEHTQILEQTLKTIQQEFDDIRNIPSDQQMEVEEIKKIRLQWKDQVDKIDSDYKKSLTKGKGSGAVGIGAGVAVAALGPTAAMGIATTFGVASTGVAISTLSGVAATNAALAWLGGGALAVGGGGMAAGSAFLALAGPVGWGIAGIAAIGSGVALLKGKSDKKTLDEVYTRIGERDIKSYNLAHVELNERILRIDDEEKRLKSAIEKIKMFDKDYNKMTENEQYELGSYVNLMNSSTSLLVNPIQGLEPKYTNEDFKEYKRKNIKGNFVEENLIVYLANLLYRIDLKNSQRKVLWNALSKNKELIKSIGISKEKFPYEVMNVVFEALDYKKSNIA